MFSWARDLDASFAPLHDPAKRWLHVALPAEQPELPHGHDGIAVLCSVIEQYLDESGTIGQLDDDQFVEGAGAVLGLLLGQHFSGSRISRHQNETVLRVGAWGMCNPFQIVYTVLEATDPRSTFAGLLRLIEQEASGRSTRARLKQMVHEQLALRMPELSILDHHEGEVHLSDGSVIDLQRLLRATDGQSDTHMLRAVDRVMDMLQHARAQPSTSSAPPMRSSNDALERIVPRLVPSSFLRQDGVRGVTLAAAAMGGGIQLCYVQRFAGRFRYVRANEPARWGLDDLAFYQLAISNLQALSRPPKVARASMAEGTVLIVRHGDGLDAARVLLPSVQERARRQLGEDLAYAVPHRDTLLIAPRAASSTRAKLMEYGAEAHARAPHGIVPHLVCVSGDAQGIPCFKQLND